MVARRGMNAGALRGVAGDQLAGAILESVTSGVCIVDARQVDMPVAYVNPAFEAMTGYSCAEMVGRNCRLLQGVDREQEALRGIRRALATEGKWVTVLRNYRKDGTPFWNELSISPLRDGAGTLTHYVGIQTDVSQRMEYEAALRESEKLAVLGRLAASIAHEINNPLESIMNLVYLARGSGTREETDGYLDMADQELQRVKLITARSLRFYRQSTRPVGVGCAELVRSVLDVYVQRLREAGIATEMRGRDEREVMCLDSEIRQVLSNLISNAMDAMAATGGRLRLRTRDAMEWRSGVKGVLITVADTGSGIAAADLPHLGRAFFTTKGEAGTGLGLWVSGEIIARHGGALKLRSSQRAGRNGTVAQLFLPCGVAGG